MSQLEAEAKQVWAELQSLKRDLMSIPVFAEAYNHVVVEKEGLGTSTKSEVATVYLKGAVYDVEVQDCEPLRSRTTNIGQPLKPLKYSNTYRFPGRWRRRDGPRVVYSAKNGVRATCPSCRKILKVLRDGGPLHPGGIKTILGWYYTPVYRHLQHLTDEALVDVRPVEPNETPALIARSWLRM